ncbi:MAG: GUN4 domain-containing protein [Drouetiella hepatica Uher 2000/2452]|uniref:GUN4 domain-containing protein n=1 Tax=Drouetiella hepatica Uher 2000/2452 TaxID=904376 RepID=A0A951UP03_9CYAN|nr:GUN4 domain-containing protein [Drouetiella hepatica Uher 2000/2452]
MADLLNRLKSESAKTQLQLIQELEKSGEPGLNALMSFLSDRRLASPNPASPSPIEGKAYQILLASDQPLCQEFLQAQFPQGLMSGRSERNIDYGALQDLLARQEFQAADRLTIEILCALAGAASEQRKWLYFTDVKDLPIADMQTINTLWQVYSEGKFGFSVQRDLWLGVGKNWESLWVVIGWKSGNAWTRYPQEFTWNLTAPKGHLPLSNQLRGVRVMAALLSHPAWG